MSAVAGALSTRVFVPAALAVALVAAPAGAASLTKVNQSDWWDGVSGLPSYVNMYIYVPNTVATRPPVVVAAHYCTGTASAYFGASSSIVSAADKNGFIMIFPEATGRNCWDVGSTASLTHDGKGDTHAIAQMVRYTLSEYSGDAGRVYVFGSSSGAMMTQAMLGVYPDLFMAGAEFSGVPCGCWADGYDTGGTPQWSNNCAGGKVSKTAAQWGDMVRAMYPGYSGHRPRIQLWHGSADTTINYNNFTESVKEWTNLLGLSETPTSTETPKNNYTRQLWKNPCGFVVLDATTIKDGTHGIPFDGASVLSFFGLDKAGGSDPETAACGGDAGVPGSGGTTGSGGTGGVRDGSAGAGGTAGGDAASSGGATGRGGAESGGGSGSGGQVGSGGASGTGGTSATATGGTTGRGGSSGAAGNATGGASASGGFTSTGGAVASGGTTGGDRQSGGATGSGSPASGGRGGGSAGSGGASGSGGTTTAGGDSPSGWGCTLGGPAVRSSTTGAALLLAALALVMHRRRRTRG